ncbi:alpha/beta hydrolase [uncultured Maricaulis sp.]|mgnify:CR=1 FL=1|uniref:alpha/beta hydrolase n=1 Tax=uncultured Maricaulis sp. TaxID=174710 RepID=UPI0030D7BCAE|tara:strand:+ start:287773 stop:288696 length:924 start_codon:yes stop_codon:yes gene_type:complete
MTTSPWTRTLNSFGLDDPFEPGRTTPHMRKALRDAAPHLDVTPPAVAAVRELAIPGPAGDIPARLYIPNGSVEPAPCVLFCHGGGYVIGDLETHDALCRRLAAVSGVRVLAVDYRLAPEHAFPAAVDDVLAAFDWLAGEGADEVGADPQRLAVAGDSAGGGLAAVLAQLRRTQLRYQLLIYPLLQLAERRKSKLKAIEGHIFSVVALDQIVRYYLGEESQVIDRRASPLLEDDLTGLPPAYIAAAELDPLRDEGQAYRDRLIASGVAVEYKLGKTLPHGYFNLTAILPGTKALIDRAALALGDSLRK